MPQEAFDILRDSGILNPDVTLGQLMETGRQLSATGGEAASSLEASVPTFVGPWYCYHQ